MTERSDVREFFRAGKVASQRDVAKRFRISLEMASRYVRQLRDAGDIEAVEGATYIAGRRGPVATFYRPSATLLASIEGGGIVDKAIASQPALAWVWHPSACVRREASA